MDQIQGEAHKVRAAAWYVWQSNVHLTKYNVVWVLFIFKLSVFVFYGVCNIMQFRRPDTALSS